MANFMQGYDERRWSQDIATHARYVEYAAQCKTERCRDLFLDRAKEIEARYPHHSKAFNAGRAALAEQKDRTK